MAELVAKTGYDFIVVGAGSGLAGEKTPAQKPVIPHSGTDGSQTRRWRKADSNRWYRITKSPGFPKHSGHRGASRTSPIRAFLGT